LRAARRRARDRADAYVDAARNRWYFTELLRERRVERSARGAARYRWQPACSDDRMRQTESARSWVLPVLWVAVVFAAGILTWASVNSPQAEAGGAGLVLLATASLLRRGLSAQGSAQVPHVTRFVAHELSPRAK